MGGTVYCPINLSEGAIKSVFLEKKDSLLKRLMFAIRAEVRDLYVLKILSAFRLV